MFSSVDYEFVSLVGVTDLAFSARQALELAQKEELEALFSFIEKICFAILNDTMPLKIFFVLYFHVFKRFSCRLTPLLAS